MAQVVGPSAPQALGVVPWGSAPFLLEHGDRHGQPVSGGPVGVVVLDVHPALHGVFMQSFATCGAAASHDVQGAEMTALTVEHQLPAHEVLERIVRLQALRALGDLAAADEQAEETDRLARRNEHPLAGVFTAWYRALRVCETDGWTAARPRYRDILARTADVGIPGFTRGAAVLVALVPVLRGDGLPDLDDFAHLDAGPLPALAGPLAAGNRRRRRRGPRSLVGGAPAPARPPPGGPMVRASPGGGRGGARGGPAPGPRRTGSGGRRDGGRGQRTGVVRPGRAVPADGRRGARLTLGLSRRSGWDLRLAAWSSAGDAASASPPPCDARHQNRSLIRPDRRDVP